MTVYISGPITGTDDYIERFAAAEEWIGANGYTAINPAKESAHKDPQTTTWEEYMGDALKLLSTANAIYMLKGWNQSKGAGIEYWVAIAMGKKVFEEGADFE